MEHAGRNVLPWSPSASKYVDAVLGNPLVGDRRRRELALLTMVSLGTRHFGHIRVLRAERTYPQSSRRSARTGRAGDRHQPVIPDDVLAANVPG